LQAEVLVVHAHLPAARAGRPADPAGWLEAAEQQCRQWTAPLSARGVLHSIDIVEHNPASALLGAAGRHGDVVVVGTRGAGGFRGLQLGSVALGVLHHATVPTVVVPPPPE
jgi:nucleotide-binding universal stress UspA family protein